MERFEQVLPSWVVTALAAGPLRYTAPLPIQQVVVPFVCAAFDAGLPADVCLTAPTGAGKTLCYLAPLLRAVRAGREADRGMRRLRAVILVPTAALADQVATVARHILAHDDSGIRLGVLGGTEADGSPWHVLPLSDGRRHVFASFDVIVATPQPVLTAVALAAERFTLDAATGSVNQSDNDLGVAPGGADVTGEDESPLPASAALLGHVRMLVVDEADDVLRGTFGNAVSRVATALDTAARQLQQAPIDQCPGLWHSTCGRTGVVHRLLCSATLTPHVARVAEVRMRNVRHFALDASGADVGSAGEAGTSAVQSKLAMPASLSENMVIVRHEEQRPAVLLRTLRHAVAQHVPPLGATGEATLTDHAAVLVFCGTAETARVLGRMLAAAAAEEGANAATPTSAADGAKAVPGRRWEILEYTSATSQTERRMAVLNTFGRSAVQIVVATDGLMRGIDLPGVRAVLMYDAPRSAPQYVHRVGRTARAGQPGHSYVLLARDGPSGTHDDGEVAKFRAVGQLLQRTREVANVRELREVDELLPRVSEYLESAKQQLAKRWASAYDSSQAPAQGASGAAAASPPPQARAGARAPAKTNGKGAPQRPGGPREHDAKAGQKRQRPPPPSR